MQNYTSTKKSGNRCGHNPKCPRLTPLVPIRKGKGGLPRILSLAAERSKSWYDQPETNPKLNSRTNRKTRTERREAILVIIETLLKRLDLHSLRVGSPIQNDFLDIDMKTIVKESGLTQRRCERAIQHLKNAGFLKVYQPRIKTVTGKYAALRAVRIITQDFFIWLGLDKILNAERAKTVIRQSHKLIKTVCKIIKTSLPYKKSSKPPDKKDIELKAAWSKALGALILKGVDMDKAQKQINTEYGFPLWWSPGQALPEK